jgi:hypothetical protein
MNDNAPPTAEERVFHDYLCVETSVEVWAVLHARHSKQYRIFSSFSDPTGTAFGGDGTEGRMETTYGFARGDHPLIGARTTWPIGDDDTAGERVHSYFLMIPRKSDDE